MKKLLSLIVAVTLLAAAVFAGGSKDSQTTSKKSVSAEELKAANVTLEFWHAQTKSNEEAMNEVVDLFNATNEYGITVNATSQGGYTDCHKKVTSALAAGSQPNVAQAYNNNILTYMPSGLLLDITDYLNDEFGISAKDKATIVPSYIEENAAYPDGRSYSTSLGKSTEVLYYNKTFFEEHNLKVPTTYDELTEVAKKATEILGKPAFGYDDAQNLSIYGPQNFGAQYATSDGTVLLFNKDNIDATMACYEWWQKGIQEGYFRIPGEDGYLSGPFGSGQVVMFIGSISGVFYVNPDGFEAAVASIPFGKNPTVIQQGGNFCGFQSGDAVTDLATSIFLEFLYTPEASALYAAGTGYAPANAAGVNEQVYKDCIAKGDLNAQAKDVASNYPEDARGFDPVFAESYATRTELGKVIETISLDKDAKIEDAIRTVADKLGCEYAE
ncbi:MAG: hypothetical protein BKP49_06085 [Treponema sp. CETP13]|nr:MAG: hypothetical protein BKP49_06085 [Treponema sp. CETP13]